MADIEHEMHRGNARTFTITVVDDTGATVDLTGRTLRWAAKRSYSDAAATISKATGGGGITPASPQSGATKGVATIALTRTDTSGLPAYATTLVCSLIDDDSDETLMPLAGDQWYLTVYPGAVEPAA